MKETLIWLMSALCLPLSPGNATAQTPQDTTYRIDSQVFETERRIRVYVPPRYNIDTDIPFVPIYLLDAQADMVWNVTKGNLEYLVQQFTIIPSILIGIVSDDRGSEFSPNSTALQQHFETEVFPLIEKEYRVANVKAVIGHSWGGAFVGNTLFGEKRDLFDAYFGISPSFDANNNVIYRAADSLLQVAPHFGKFFYFSSGDVGSERKYLQDNQRMDSLLSLYPSPSLAWKVQHFSDLDHFSSVGPALANGLVSMSRHYRADQKVMLNMAHRSEKDFASQMDAFYQSRDSLFGFSYRPIVGYYKYVADQLRNREMYTAAIATYQIGLARNPKHLSSLIGLAETYLRMEDKERARPLLEKLSKELEFQKDNISMGFYKTHSKWVREKLRAARRGE
ncbi:MAG: alpha/beta hydrolase-fold protein [Bacteroidota bacterium]